MYLYPMGKANVRPGVALAGVGVFIPKKQWEKLKASSREDVVKVLEAEGALDDTGLEHSPDVLLEGLQRSVNQLQGARAGQTKLVPAQAVLDGLPG